MAKVFTEQPIVDAGIRSVNFFNGRLLTAEDLTAEQTANLQARRLLGQALGDGIARGFFVSISGKPEDFLVSVDAGLAVNRRGDALQLNQQTIVSLTGSLKSPGEQIASVFSDCTQLPSGQFTPTGLYLLTISPAAAGEGRAPTSGLGNTSAPCNTRFIVQGVTFHLIRLSTPAISNHLRNILAYQSMGYLPTTESLISSNSPLTEALEAPFTPPPAGYGLLDTLSPDKFPVCHVPLALIFTTAGRIDFVDNWSVRRRVTAPTGTQPWQAALSPRRRSESEAAFLQFQEHLAGLVEAKSVSPTFKASSRFKLLPPVGFLPGGASGCDWRTFLGVHAPAYETRMDSGLLASLLEEALACSPFVVEDNTRPPAAIDVFSIQGSSAQIVKTIDANLAGQLEQVDRETLYKLLKLKSSEPGFVLFARSRRGRIRLFFTAQNFQRSAASFRASSTESNLEMTATPATSGDFILPSIEPGYYLVNGSIQGFKPILPSVAEVVAGQVTTISITPVPLTLRLCFVTEGIERMKLSNLRFCLVEGTFDTAVALSKFQPWAEFVQVEVNSAAARKQVAEWQVILNERFPDRGIDQAEPQLFMSDLSNRSPAERAAEINKVIGKAGFGTAENPLAYVVYGETGFPLTFVSNTNINRDPIPLADLLKTMGKGRMLTYQSSTLLLLKKLIEYGIVFIEQVAGAWTDLIMDAAGVTRTQANVLIDNFAAELSEIDNKI